MSNAPIFHKGDRVIDPYTGTRGTHAGLAVAYNQHGHRSIVTLVKWDNSDNAAPWPYALDLDIPGAKRFVIRESTGLDYHGYPIPVWSVEDTVLGVAIAGLNGGKRLWPTKAGARSFAYRANVKYADTVSRNHEFIR